MSEIQRIPKEIAGVGDMVGLDANCAHMKFLEREMKQEILPCGMLASWEAGTVSVQFIKDGQNQMITVRLDEMTALLQEAAEARKDSQK